MTCLPADDSLMSTAASRWPRPSNLNSWGTNAGKSFIRSDPPAGTWGQQQTSVSVTERSVSSAWKLRSVHSNSPQRTRPIFSLNCTWEQLKVSGRLKTSVPSVCLNSCDHVIVSPPAGHVLHVSHKHCQPSPNWWCELGDDWSPPPRTSRTSLPVDQINDSWLIVCRSELIRRSVCTVACVGHFRLDRQTHSGC